MAVLIQSGRFAAAGWSTPADTTGLVAWYESSDPANYTVRSGIKLSQWHDLSGNGYHLDSPGSANDPDLDDVQQNGLDTIRFFTTPYYWKNASVSFTHNYVSMFGVMRCHTSATTNGGIVVLHGAGTNDYNTTNSLIIETPNSTTIDAYSNGTLGTKTHTSDVYFTWASIMDGTNHTMYVNGSAGTPVARTAALSATKLLVGARYYGSTYQAGLNGWQGELIIADAAIEPGERADIETYLNDKWACY